MSRKLQGIAGALLVVALAGCGAPTLSMPSSATSSVKASAVQRLAPPAAPSQGVSASDYSFLDQTRHIAYDALTRYEDLRQLWYSTTSDEQKDRIELQMVDSLTEGLKDIRRVAAGTYGYDAQRMYDLADRSLRHYDDLQSAWELASGDRDRRTIVNRMLVDLTGVLKQIRDAR